MGHASGEHRAISPQVEILAAALIAAAVNLVTANAVLGSEEGVTLVDQIHIVALLSVLIAAAVTVGWRTMIERGWGEAAASRLSRRAGMVAAVLFLVIDALLIARAARAG
jgi:hypothetical protein